MARKPVKFGPRNPVPRMPLGPVWARGKKIPKKWGIFSYKTRRAVLQKRNRGFIVHAYKFNKTAKQIESIVLWLQRKGILVPRIEAIDTKNRLVLFEKTGKTLAEYLGLLKKHGKGLNKQQEHYLSRVFSKIARALGSMHANGFIHTHPHSRNIILYRNRVGFIDFMLSRIEVIDWSNSSEIIKRFNKDWFNSSLFFVEQEKVFPGSKDFFRVQKRKFFSKLLRKYPLTEKVRAQLREYFSRNNYL